MKFCFEHSNPDAQVIYAVSIDWIPIVLLTLVTYNIKLYLPRILIQSPCLFMYAPGHVYNSAPTGLDRSVGDSINVLNILESVVFLVFYMTFSNLQNCVKSFIIFLGGACPLISLDAPPHSKSWLRPCLQCSKWNRVHIAPKSQRARVKQIFGNNHHD